MAFSRGSFIRCTLLIAASAVAAACEPRNGDAPADAATPDTAAIRTAIDSLGAQVMRANESGDAELYATTWAEDGIMATPGSPPVVGRDSIVAAFQRRPPLPEGATMTIHPTELQILSAEWAYVMGTDTLTFTPPGAAAPVKDAWTFLVLLRKTGEGWQTYREVLTANQPSP